MQHRLLLAAGLLASGSLRAQSPISITQSTYPATPATVERYEVAHPATHPTAGPPAPGANQTWDYSTLTPDSSVTEFGYLAPPASPFAAATRAFDNDHSWQRYHPPFAYYAKYVAFEALTAAGLQELGFTVPGQSVALATGVAGDSLRLPAQSCRYDAGTYRLRFPLTTGTGNVRRIRTVLGGVVTLQRLGLQQAPCRLVHYEWQQDSVAGWGTVRLPAAAGGATAPLPALLQRTHHYATDSVYLGNQPAPAALLQLLGIVQGQVRADYYDAVYRENSAQPALLFCYRSAAFQSLQPLFGIWYSGEAGLVSSTQGPRPATNPAGLQAYPNPAPAGRLTVAAPDGRRSALRLLVLDQAGRVVAAGPATTGQPTELLRGLPPGLYLLVAEEASGRRSTLRISVQ
jgi:hypothetical protein